MSSPSASELKTSDRSEDHGAVPVDVDIGRAVEHALQVAFAQPAQFEGDLPAGPGEAVGGGVHRAGHGRGGRQQGVDDLDHGRHRAAPLVHRLQRQVTGRALLGGEGPGQAGTGQGLEQHQLAAPHLTVAQVGGRGAGVEGVEPNAAPGGDADGLHPEERRQRPVLTLGVEDRRLAPEHPLALQVRLDEGALALAEDACHQHVRSGEYAGV